ncbi:MAG: DUF6878 family protein [Bosea sp. (in: a-proteobacteria)]
MTEDPTDPGASGEHQTAAHQPEQHQPDTVMSDYMAKEAAHRSLSASLRPSTKANLFAVLAGAGIVKVTVEFDGEGDSGQIETIEATDASGAPCELPANLMLVHHAVWGEPESRSHEMTIPELIESLAYDLLSDTHGGWEINDGSYGIFTFDVAAGSITLECNVRFVDSEQHTTTF